MNLRNATIPDEGISINITYPPGHENSIELPENPAYTTLMFIGLAFVTSGLCYFISTKFNIGENLFSSLARDESPTTELTGITSPEEPDMESF